MNGHKRLTPSLFFGLLAGLLFSVIAFSQAAASVGLAIDSFRPLGGSFFSWRAGQTRAAIKLMEQGSRVNSATAQRFGRITLAHSPLTPRSLWLIGKSMEINGNVKGARRAMSQAEIVSRRDSAVQLWLGSDRLRNGAIAPGLRHFDLLIRSDRNAAGEVIPRMAMIIMSPEGRRYLAPYIREDNPWLLGLFQVAVTELPRAAPIAQLLLERRKTAPDIPNIRQVYSPLMNRLVDEGSYRLALQLYPLLPGANPASMRNVSGIVAGQIDEGYPPLIWNLAASNEQGAEFVSVAGGAGLDIFGAPGTIGLAATKLVAPKPGDALFWSVLSRSSNLDSGANWIATCLIGKSAKRKTESVDMLDADVPVARTLRMELPEDCALVRLDIRIAGGIGRDPATLVVAGLELASATSTK